jgi:hypothetical protein
MLRALLNLFRRPAVRMGRVDNACIRRTRIRNAQFVSFINSSACQGGRHADRHDQRLRRQKLMRGLLALAGAGGLGWVVLESARAFAMF